MERNRNYLTLLVGVCIGTSILGSNLTSLRLSPKILLLSTYYRETLARRHRRHTNSRIFTVIFLIFFFFNFNYLCNRMLWLQIVEHSTKQRGNFKTKRKFSHKKKVGEMCASRTIPQSKTQALSSSDVFPQSQETCSCFNHSIHAQPYRKLVVQLCKHLSSTCRAEFF